MVEKIEFEGFQKRFVFVTVTSLSHFLYRQVCYFGQFKSKSHSRDITGYNKEQELSFGTKLNGVSAIEIRDPKKRLKSRKRD